MALGVKSQTGLTIWSHLEVLFFTANIFAAKASEATCGQALDHQNHNTYLKYQAQLKSLDIQALFYDLAPDYECCDMEQSMAHHQDPNVP